jgi:hypothetical protein
MRTLQTPCYVSYGGSEQTLRTQALQPGAGHRYSYSSALIIAGRRISLVAGMSQLVACQGSSQIFQVVTAWPDDVVACRFASKMRARDV